MFVSDRILSTNNIFVQTQWMKEEDLGIFKEEVETQNTTQAGLSSGPDSP